MSAYLFHHGDSASARETASAAIHKRLGRLKEPTEADRLEVLFVDRIRRVAGESAQVFAAKRGAAAAQYVRPWP